MPSPLLELLNVSCSVESGNVLFDDVNVKLHEGWLSSIAKHTSMAK